MSSEGVNKKFAKCFILFMAIIILLQGLVYLGLSIWGISVHNNCTSKLTQDSPLDFVLNFIYFWDSECGPIGITIETGQTYNIEIQNFHVAARTYIFFIVYACVSALWIVTSLLVFTALCSVVNKVSYALCFWPWLLSVIGGSIVDVVATGYHIHDIYHTTSAADTLKYLEVQAANEVLEKMKNFDSYFIIPGVIFACISSRIVLIWVLNIFGVIFSISVAKSVVNHRENIVPYVNKRLSSNVPIVMEPPPATNRQISRPESVSEAEVEVEPIPPPQMRRERRTLEPLKSPDVESPTNSYNEYNSPEPNVSPAIFVERPQSSLSNKRVKELRNTAVVPVALAPTYVSSESHPENLDYPNGQTVSSGASELSESPLNQRYSTQDGFPFLSQPHITQELRGQLPWSYFNFREDIEARKQVHSHSYANEEDDLPPIPVPDYTLHPPKKDRQSLSPNSSQTATRW